IVLAFSLGAYFLAYALKGDQLHINQMEVVDFDASSGAVRGTLWSNLFSPQLDSYNLSLGVQTSSAFPSKKPHVLLSWMGLPGSAFGGMNQRAHHSSLFSRPYDFSRDLDQMYGMPISVWSTKGVTGRWYYPGQANDNTETSAPSPQTETGFAADLKVTSVKTASGTIQNNTAEEVKDAVLLYDRWAYPIDR